MEEKEKQIQEIQILEQNLQNILLQKQSFQIEFSEADAALNELEKSKDDVFKIIGQLMIKTEKEKVKKELLEKKALLELRLSSIEKKEESLVERSNSLRKEILEQQNK